MADTAADRAVDTSVSTPPALPRLVEVVELSGRVKHLAVEGEVPPRGLSRLGSVLCPRRVIDLRAADDPRAPAGATRWPVCGGCERAAARALARAEAQGRRVTR